jgi:diaminohydroxyphosphoribosylaminopyrimidine deaminase/5-amino-6-(5-phosphoribosylamino)uracil reductase
MAMALDLARLGLGRTSPNPAVGAVIVKNGKVVATGFHKRAGLPHAEIEALSSPCLREDWKEATLYVTLEPCCHHGRTPPCTDAIIKSGIKEVVIGMRDPDPKVSGSGIRILKRHGIRVREGILRRECERLNEGYVKHRTTGLPFVIMKIAATLDGKVAMKTGRSRWITGPEARAFGRLIRDRVDGILVGINTVLKDDPRLTARLKGRRGRDPVRIILDSSLRIQPTAKVLNVKSPAPSWIATTVKKNHPKIRQLTKKGTEVLCCRSDRNGDVHLKDLLRRLGDRGIVYLLVEGGPTVYAGFLNRKLVDQMVLFIAPFFLGDQGISMFPGNLRFLPPLRNVSCRTVGRDLLIEGDL